MAVPVLFLFHAPALQCAPRAAQRGRFLGRQVAVVNAVASCARGERLGGCGSPQHARNPPTTGNAPLALILNMPIGQLMLRVVVCCHAGVKW